MIIKEGRMSSSDMSFVDDTIMDELFPWYYCNESTTEHFPFFKHSLISRHDSNPVIDSSTYPLFEKVLNTFCKENGIVINEILRASLNLTYYNSEEFGDPHVDYPFDSWNVLMYLNKFNNGETLIFNEEYGNGGFNDCVVPVSDSLKLTIGNIVMPEKGKIVGWYGKNFHASKWCDEGQRRVVGVFVFK